MKIHPVVGAEILERVEFPYPVVPIVRSHHEKWDGSGYPDGLKGEEIPIGARILAAVDCLDALASDRQYRRALPLDEAMARVASEAGTAFDPAVVRALAGPLSRAGSARQIDPGRAPAVALGEHQNHPRRSTGDRLRSRRRCPRESRRRKARRHSPNMPATGLCSLHWEEALAVASIRIQHLIGYDAIALCACDEDVVFAKFAGGRRRGQARRVASSAGRRSAGVGSRCWQADFERQPGRRARIREKERPSNFHPRWHCLW